MHVACLSHILVYSIFGIALLHGVPKVLHHVAEQCQTVNNLNEIKHTQPHVKGCLHAELLAFESAIEAATQSQPKCKLCLHIMNIAQKLQKRPPQGVALICSSKKACRLSDNVCFFCFSGNWCVWHTTEMHCSNWQPRKRKAEKNPGKGGLLLLHFLLVLKAVMCFFCCKTHLLHSLVGNMNP